MTEGTPVAGYHPPYTGRGRPESIGRALPGCEIKIVDPSGKSLDDGEVGELVFRSPSNMNGYYNRPEATAETLRDGWLWSGDLGRRDAEGYFFIVGRSKDMVIHGGANIYPAELESVLVTHPAVSECAVIGVPDLRFGENVRAYVVLRGGATATADQLKEFMGQHLAAYKIPDDIAFLDSLPRGPTGKVLKRALVDMSRTRERAGA
jgi:long-chain acyl-CoA synthetase